MFQMSFDHLNYNLENLLVHHLCISCVLLIISSPYPDNGHNCIQFLILNCRQNHIPALFLDDNKMKKCIPFYALYYHFHNIHIQIINVLHRRKQLFVLHCRFRNTLSQNLFVLENHIQLPVLRYHLDSIQNMTSYYMENKKNIPSQKLNCHFHHRFFAKRSDLEPI